MVPSADRSPSSESSTFSRCGPTPQKPLFKSLSSSTAIAQEYKNVTTTICSELARLTLASDELRRHNAQLMAQEQTNSWWLLGAIMLSILLVGIVAGISMEKSGTTEALVNLGTQVERIQTPAAVPVVAAKKTRK
jgi:hypothetical protein